MVPTLTPPAMGASPVEAFKKHKIPIGIKLMCVAYICPKNIVNIFTYRRVNRLEETPVSSYME